MGGIELNNLKKKRGGVELPDLDPQDGAIWPLGQVHKLGLEQKPSPHKLRQIAAKKKQHSIMENQFAKNTKEYTGKSIKNRIFQIWPSLCMFYRLLCIT